MDDNERYTDSAGWEDEELPTPWAELRVQKERVDICWGVQAPGIKHRVTPRGAARCRPHRR